MIIYGVYIVSKSGGLIFNLDNNVPRIEHERVFTYPLELVLDYDAKKVSVSFNRKDGINVGHVLVGVNGIAVNGGTLDDGRDVKATLEAAENYPINLKFTRPKMTTNEKIFLASMFYQLYAMACQLSPEPKSSGIESLEADTFTLHCFQTLTGVKFIVISETGLNGMDLLLRKIYELYSDYVLKNPFYSLEMPIRCELFDNKLQELLTQVEKTGISNIDK
ncbi:trafficking protein particle complex subunit 4 [Scaptodrosophila lebanonensis]|uniref:Trafficking protein particle complex subunit n=1 Tax=Drosophila lebanonensis TaxID=7225 RepID=A0A6J2TNJ5_DROLE|nr:trafficking protein particle complex subunit 4 [Scaptodrosophila lebanonensis]